MKRCAYKAPLAPVMASTILTAGRFGRNATGRSDRTHRRGNRRTDFDFDVEAAVRLVWRGTRPINLPAPVRYFSAEEGGVSHFNYVRDNLLLSWMHLRLLVGFLLRLPLLLARKIRFRAIAN